MLDDSINPSIYFFQYVLIFYVSKNYLIFSFKIKISTMFRNMNEGEEENAQKTLN